MFQIYPQAFTPLAPRNPNTCPFPSSLSMSTSTSTSTAKPTFTPARTINKLPSHHDPHQPSQRRTPPKTLSVEQQKEQQQNRRREAYLGKVRQKREDRTWEGRSEMILRAEFLERQRAWEEERRREAAEALLPAPDEEEDDAGEEDVEGEEVEMVDRILSQEEEEFEALVEGWGREGERGREGYGYGSEDDEEWDRLFREVVGMDTGVGIGLEGGEGGGRDKSGDGDGGMDMS